MPNKRISFAQKHEADKTNNTDDLFRKTSDGEVHEENQNLRRQTYYLDEDIIEAIRKMAYYTRKDKSELVRDLLRNSSLNKYIP